MSQPALSQVPGGSSTALAGPALRRTTASSVLPCGIHPAPCPGSRGLAEQGSGLWLAVSGGGRDPSADRRRSPTPGRRDRVSRYSAHLGADSPASSSCALRGAGRRTVCRSSALDSVQPQVLSAGQGLRSGVSRKVSGCPGAGLSETPAHPRRSVGSSPITRAVCRSARHRCPPQLGGLCQASLCRTRSGLDLSFPLYPPHCHRQLPPRFHSRRQNHLSLARLRPWLPDSYHDARWG